MAPGIAGLATWISPGQMDDAKNSVAPQAAQNPLCRQGECANVGPKHRGHVEVGAAPWRPAQLFVRTQLQCGGGWLTTAAIETTPRGARPHLAEVSELEAQPCVGLVDSGIAPDGPATVVRVSGAGTEQVMLAGRAAWTPEGVDRAREVDPTAVVYAKGSLDGLAAVMPPSRAEDAGTPVR